MHLLREHNTSMSKLLLWLRMCLQYGKKALNTS
jgi:hypothetical protein